MRIKYFQDTDTLYIEFRTAQVAETKDLDEDTILDLDRDGNICALTVTTKQAGSHFPRFSFEQVAALNRAPAVAAHDRGVELQGTNEC